WKGRLAPFDCASFVSASFDSASFDSASFDSASFDSASFDSAQDRPDRSPSPTLQMGEGASERFATFTVTIWEDVVGQAMPASRSLGVSRCAPFREVR
ncbi:MAG: hypothetical protein KJ558_00890, partial [Gammaproteobacteria bacterium]|nr:hypothetical protein [Gammaproteobacteria bacterium]